MKRDAYLVMDYLTQRQREVLNYISERIETSGYPPTIREIGDKLKIKSPKGVKDHLTAIEKKGYIQCDEKTSRGIKLTKNNSNHLIPPNLAVITEEELLSKSAWQDIFILKLTTISLREAGILKGDFIVIQHQPAYSKGNIILAIINKKITLRKINTDNCREIIFADELSQNTDKHHSTSVVRDFSPVNLIIGRVVGLMRRME